MKLHEAARQYLGARWRHVGRSAGRLDCAGLIIKSYEDCGVVIDAPTRYSRDPVGSQLIELVQKFGGSPVWAGPKGACRLFHVEPDDVVVMSPASKPRHLAIVGADPMYGRSLIHADGSPGVWKVVEHGLSDFYLNMIVAVFRRPV